MATHTPPLQPAYPDPADIPLIKSQRLTHTRKKQLVKAAQRPLDDPPPPPKPDECCASSCDPCVKTLWKEEKDAWSQRWGQTALDAHAHAQSQPHKPTATATRTMPGAFDW